MGPLSGNQITFATHMNCREGISCTGPGCRIETGKTKTDRANGKQARNIRNRHADPIRERGGKQFGKG